MTWWKKRLSGWSAGGRACAPLMLLAACAAAAGQSLPRARVVDVQIDAAALPDVAFGDAGTLLVAYQHSMAGGLKLADVGCSGAQHTVLDERALPGWMPALAVDSLGIPSVVHLAFPGKPSRLYYTLDGGELYGLQTVPINGTDYCAAPVYALDSVDRPYVAYIGQNALPGFAFFDITSGAWAAQSLPAMTSIAINSRNIAIRVNRQDRPVMAYYDQAGNLVVLTRGDAGWSMRTYAVPGAPPATGLSLALDSVGAANVALATPAGLSVYRFNVLNVTVQTVVAGVPVGIVPHGMVMDGQNRIRIAFVDQADGSLKLARNDYGWSVTLVAVGPVDSASLALDPHGHWGLAWSESAAGLLKAATQDGLVPRPADFNCDGHVDSGDVGFFVSCATGPAMPQADVNCLAADFDADLDVDQDDFGVVQRCYRGAALPADAHCAD